LQYITAIDRFYEAAANPALWPEALSALSTEVGCRGALLTTPVFIPGGLVHSNGLQEAVNQFFEQGWYRDDVRNAAVTNRHWRSGFFSDHSLFSGSTIARSEYYEKFARSAGVPWFAAGRLTGDLKSDAISISLQRDAGQGAFQPHELASLTALLPRLQPSMALASRLAQMHGKAMVEGLQLVKQASILLKPNGSVAFVNPAAEGHLGRGLHIRRHRLTAVNAAEDRKLQGLISQACGVADRLMLESLPLAPVVLQPTDHNGRLIITSAPLRRRGADMLGFSGAILMITDLSASSKLPEDVLQLVFGLTKREADIMSLLGAGHTTQEIGEFLQSAKDTVRHHLKVIFQKTGVSRQSELVAICVRMEAARPAAHS